MSSQKPEGKSNGRGPHKPDAELRPTTLPPTPPAPPRRAPQQATADTERTRKPTGGDPLSELLKKAQSARGGPAVEALERAAELLETRGDAEQAIWRLEEALRRA